MAGRDDEYLPALRFHRLTPLFDFVAAVAVRDGTIKRRVLAHAALTGGEAVLDVGVEPGRSPSRRRARPTTSA
jgi:hypothetical protein